MVIGPTPPGLGDIIPATSGRPYPVKMPLETWGEFEGKQGIASTLQPAMGRITDAPDIGNVFLKSTFGNDLPDSNLKTYLFSHFTRKGYI